MTLFQPTVTLAKSRKSGLLMASAGQLEELECHELWAEVADVFT